MGVARHQVVLFLFQLKKFAERRFILAGRDENMETLEALGITRQDVRHLVAQMEPEDYVSGPEPHHKNSKQEDWVFGLEIERQEVYVKLILISEPEQCVCLSFHLAERPLEYRFKRGER